MVTSNNDFVISICVDACKLIRFMIRLKQLKSNIIETTC